MGSRRSRGNAPDDVARGEGPGSAAARCVADRRRCDDECPRPVPTACGGQNRVRRGAARQRLLPHVLCVRRADVRHARPPEHPEPSPDLVDQGGACACRENPGLHDDRRPASGPWAAVAARLVRLGLDQVRLCGCQCRRPQREGRRAVAGQGGHRRDDLREDPTPRIARRCAGGPPHAHTNGNGTEHHEAPGSTEAPRSRRPAHAPRLTTSHLGAADGSASPLRWMDERGSRPT